MIDLSKFEKVYEWDDSYGISFKRRILSGPVVYLIKIGDGMYINASPNLSTTYEVYLSLLRKGRHPNSKMSEYFSKYKKFEVYVLETVNVLDLDVDSVREYISKYNPIFNDTDAAVEIDKSVWDKECDFETIEAKIRKHYLEGIDTVCEEYGLTRDEIINTAITYFLDTKTIREGWKFSNFGIVTTIKGNINNND